MTSPQDLARAIHASLDTDEIREHLDTAVSGRGASYSVLFPGPDRYSLFLGDVGSTGGLTEVPAHDALQRLFKESSDRVTALDTSVNGSPVVAASALCFREEKYGLFLLHRDRSDGGGSPDRARDGGPGDEAARTAGTDILWWQGVVDALSSELVKAQLYEAANRESASSATKLDALNEAGDLVKYVELQTLLAKLMELSVRIMKAEVGAIVLDRDGELTTGIEWGLTEEVLKSLRAPDGTPLLRHWVDEGKSVFIPDATSSPLIDTANLDVCLSSLTFVPLVTQSKHLGAIVVLNAGSGTLREEDAHVLETIAALCAAAIENAVLYEATRQHARITAEMNLASDVQFSLFPAEFESSPGLEIAGWCVTATETGGDFYDYFDLGDGKTGIVIADATGHGMGAALLVFIARATLRALLTHTQDLAEVMRVTNDLVESDSDDARFLTCFFGILDREKRQLRYCSAGHDPPIVRRAADGETRELETGGIPIGMFPGVEYSVAEAQLEQDDFVVLGTDGIWEARNPAGEFYGKKRFFQAVEETYALPTLEAGQRLRTAILDFHEGGERLDDITAVVFHVR